MGEVVNFDEIQSNFGVNQKENWKFQFGFFFHFVKI